MSKEIQIDKKDLHPHIKSRMRQRGVTLEEIKKVMAEGWTASESKPGAEGRVLVFPFGAEWEGRHYEEKEVTVYYKNIGEHDIILLTVVARYGSDFTEDKEE